MSSLSISDLTEIKVKREKLSLRVTTGRYVVSFKVAVQINAPVHGCRLSVDLDQIARSRAGPDRSTKWSDQIEKFS